MDSRPADPGVAVGVLMELVSNLALGFSVALTPANVLYCLVGAVIGTLVGVLPGIGPIATLSMLLPITFHLPPVSALIMLAGIYYGAQYGGSTTAILVNLPGEASSVVTCMDGYQMARQGRAGSALAVAALASLFAGCVGTLILAGFAPPLARAALQFGPAEYFSLMVLGLVMAIVLAQGGLATAFGMIALGVLLGLAGSDVNTGAERLTFGLIELADGIDFVPLAMGLYAIPEIVRNLEQPEHRSVLTEKIQRLWPTGDDFRRSWPAAVRGTAVGSALGVLPGSGSMLSSFSAYMLEKQVSQRPGEFGKGAVEGVAAPEASNNAHAQTSFIPLLTLGIPANAVMALMAGAMTTHGIQPGPQVMGTRPDLFWGMIASMWIGNLLLVVINLPLIRMWVALLQVPYRLLYLAILAFCCVGVYSLNNSTFDVLMLIVFSLMGYAFMKWRLDPAPLLLAFILGRLIEENLRKAMLISNGDPAVFVTRPLSLVLLLAALAMIVLVLLPKVRRRRDEALQE
jgi:putative tricarboxylic transport membrane protein